MTTITVQLTSEQRVALMHAESLTIELPEPKEGERIHGNHNCHDVVLQIMQLAMMSNDVIHIMVDYSAHVSSVTVTVLPADTDYQGSQDRIHREDISLNSNRFEDDATPLTQLLTLEDKLIDLIAEARDNAEVAA